MDVSSDGLFGAFEVQRIELEQMIRGAESGKMSVDEMIQVYYHISNMSAMTRVLKGQDDVVKNERMSSLISDTERLVSERFDAVIHQRIKNMISDMIQSVTEDLLKLQQSSSKSLQQRQQHKQLQNPAARSADSVKDGYTKEYDRLKSLMSIREFVEQYDALIRGSGKTAPS